MSQRRSTGRVRAVVLALGLLSSGASYSPKAHAETVSARLGYLFFVHARSLAFEHRFKPALRLQALSPLGNGWSWGGALSGVLTTDFNYGLWSAQARGRYAGRMGGAELGAELGLGLGHNAPLLHSDLIAKSPLVPVVAVSADSSWQLADDLWLGVALETEQWAAVTLGAVVRLEL